MNRWNESIESNRIESVELLISDIHNQQSVGRSMNSFEITTHGYNYLGSRSTVATENLSDSDIGMNNRNEEHTFTLMDRNSNKNKSKFIHEADGLAA
jgi:hypothetical protein